MLSDGEVGYTLGGTGSLIGSREPPGWSALPCGACGGVASRKGSPRLTLWLPCCVMSGKSCPFSASGSSSEKQGQAQLACVIGRAAVWPARHTQVRGPGQVPGERRVPSRSGASRASQGQVHAGRLLSFQAQTPRGPALGFGPLLSQAACRAGQGRAQPSGRPT